MKEGEAEGIIRGKENEGVRGERERKERKKEKRQANRDK